MRDIECARRQIAHHTLARFRSRVGHDRNIDKIAVLQPAAGEVALVDEHDVTAPGNSAIAIVHAVYRRVVLIVTSDCRERESFTIRDTRILLESGTDEKIGLLRWGQPLALPC